MGLREERVQQQYLSNTCNCVKYVESPILHPHPHLPICVSSIVRDGPLKIPHISQHRQWQLSTLYIPSI